MSCYSLAEKITPVRADFLVELRRFEPRPPQRRRPLTEWVPLPPLQDGIEEAGRRTGVCFCPFYVPHQSGHRTFPGVRVAATTVICCSILRRRSPSRSSARWTSHGSSLIWA